MRSTRGGLCILGFIAVALCGGCGSKEVEIKTTPEQRAAMRQIFGTPRSPAAQEQQEQRHNQLTDANSQLQMAVKESRRQATSDPLTGLANRAALDAYLKVTCPTASTPFEPLGLIIVDLDYFKQINDTYGHSAGDEVLRSAARVIRKHTREQDIAVRYGGDEFLI